MSMLLSSQYANQLYRSTIFETGFLSGSNATFIAFCNCSKVTIEILMRKQPICRVLPVY